MEVEVEGVLEGEGEREGREESSENSVLPESLKFLKYEVCRERKGKKGQLMLGDLTRKKHSPT